MSEVHATPDRTYTDLPDSEIGLAESPEPTEKKGIHRIFQDAAEYSEVLKEMKPTSSRKSSEDADIGPVRGFADLVGRDLDDTKPLGAADRFAKLTVNSWPEGEESFTGRVTQEPDSYDEEEDDDDDSDHTLEKDTARKILAWAEGSGQLPEEEIVKLKLADAEIPIPEARSESPSSQSSGESKLSPEEVVNILADEFGKLTIPGEPEERLLLESDGAFIKDVAILGMVHLTTHRIAFHASLLSTRPDLLPEQQIIKKGPITLHRSGLHRKRKLWMELSHDMICSFASSKEEDRIKPLRSILLSSLAGVEPEDPQNPRIVRLKFKTSVGHKNMYATVDNEEAARDWRREIQGALFLYRHRRAAILSNKVDNELNGVRMSIPLSRIENIAGRCFMNISGIFAIQLSDLDNDDSSSSDSTDPASPESRDARTIELAIVQPDALWRNVQSLVDEAKANLERYPDKLVPRAIIDFGGLCFLEAERILSMSSGGEQDHSIKTKLGLGDEGEIWRMKARIVKCVCSSGWLVVSPRFVGFWSKSLTASDIVYRLPTSMVVSATPVQRKYSTSFGMKLVLEGRSDLLFTFPKAEERDEAVKRITAVVAVEHDRISGNSSLSSKIKDDSPDSSRPETPRSTSDVSSFQSSGLPSPTQILSSIEHTVDRARLRNFPQKVGIEMQSRLPKVVNLPQNSIPLLTPKHFVCLTIGSRGDVQPYIALGLGLMKDGHTVTIVTHEEYKEWVEGWGIRHRTAGGDPGALMKLSVEHKMFSPQFFKESLGNFRKWLDELLVDAWEQCKDADVLLESPSAMAGVHIAEALHIPYFRTFTMPWTKTTAFPHSFLSPPVESASFNVSSYILFDNVFWAATSGQVNRWRRHTLKLGNTDMGHLAQSKIPFIYNFSTAVVPKPMDWGDSIVISGYWFLDNPELKWTPPTTLLDWIAKARADGKAIVYIGFGSITVPDPAAMTRSIIKAVLKSDVRAIISKGWSARMAKSDEPEIELPPECYTLDKVPHDWLFPQIDAALHHGGAGTTGASLRAGIPTLIKPWFGDQFFWASRVQKLGAGLKVSSLRSSDLSHALTKATTNRIMKERAATVGQRIRMEDGVRVAIDAIYTYLPRAGRERTGKEKH